MKSPTLAIAAFITSSMGACAWWMAGRPGAPVQDAIVFPHAVHVGDNGIECAKCHAGLAEANDTSKGHLPKEAVCLECHEREDNCKMCHTDVGKAKARGEHTSELGFSHAAHLARTNGDCATCHRDAATSTALPVTRPTMDTCLACHNHNLEYDEARCQHCHPRMQALPLAAVAEFDHAGAWSERHGILARVEGAQCTACHAQSMCAECHGKTAADIPSRLFPERVDVAQIHRGDWVSTHGLEARSDGGVCLRCHQSSSCESCHAEHGVSPAGNDGRNPHPPGYALGGHGRDARRHIETCAGCHDQGAASVCVDCHRVGGVGGNPHPQGFTDRHELEDAGERTMCMYCHG